MHNGNSRIDNWPNLFIIGAAKSGTTSLHAYLSEHPDIYMSTVKEPHYFSNLKPSKAQRYFGKVISDTDNYLSLFKNAKNHQFVGEASPSYLWKEGTALRILKKSPQAKIVILLRDPIERAFSHYLMDVRDGRQTKDFYNALKNDFNSEVKGWGISHLYVELGQYAVQVANYVREFGRSNVKILFFENFISEPESTLKELYDFLQVSCKLPENLGEKYNPYAAPRNRISKYFMGTGYIRLLAKAFPKNTRNYIRNNILLKDTIKPNMDNKSIEFLKSIYDNDIKNLEAILKEDLSILRKSW